MNKVYDIAGGRQVVAITKWKNNWKIFNVLWTINMWHFAVYIPLSKKHHTRILKLELKIDSFSKLIYNQIFYN